MICEYAHHKKGKKMLTVGRQMLCAPATGNIFFTPGLKSNGGIAVANSFFGYIYVCVYTVVLVWLQFLRFALFLYCFCHFVRLFSSLV